MWTNLYLGVGDTEHALYEAIMLCGLENRDIELPILLHPLSVTSGPVRVTHLLWSSEGLLYRKVHFYFLFAITSQMLMTLWGKPEQAAWNEWCSLRISTPNCSLLYRYLQHVYGSKLREPIVSYAWM